MDNNHNLSKHPLAADLIPVIGRRLNTLLRNWFAAFGVVHSTFGTSLWLRILALKGSFVGIFDVCCYWHCTAVGKPRDISRTRENRCPYLAFSPNVHSCSPTSGRLQIAQSEKKSERVEQCGISHSPCPRIQMNHRPADWAWHHATEPLMQGIQARTLCVLRDPALHGQKCAPGEKPWRMHVYVGSVVTDALSGAFSVNSLK